LLTVGAQEPIQPSTRKKRVVSTGRGGHGENENRIPTNPRTLPRPPILKILVEKKKKKGSQNTKRGTWIKNSKYQTVKGEPLGPRLSAPGTKAGEEGLLKKN